MPGRPANPNPKPVIPAPPAPTLDKLIHERVRLAVMSTLATHPVVSFSELKHALTVTDGNLSIHTRRLEEAGYIDCKKSFEGRTPRTEYRLTAAGRRAYTKYLSQMEALIHATRPK